MDRHVIFGVHLTDRVRHADEVQRTFTAYGANIKTRLGLHEVNAHASAPNGLILLEMVGDDAALDELAGKLKAIDGVEVQRMVFRH